MAQPALQLVPAPQPKRTRRPQHWQQAAAVLRATPSTLASEAAPLTSPQLAKPTSNASFLLRLLLALIVIQAALWLLWPVPTPSAAKLPDPAPAAVTPLKPLPERVFQFVPLTPRITP
jgi:hypothetical protein